jgi:predicted ArsR family transcriptional regulator
VLTALAEKARTINELREATGATEPSLRRLLTRLDDLGLVTEERAQPSGRGRPARRWRLDAAAELTTFLEAADTLRRGLARRRAQDDN